MLAYKIQSIESQYISFQTAINTVQKNNITVMCTALLKLNSFSALITQVTTCMLFSFICWTKYTFTF